MRNVKLFDSVALLLDLPEENLERGQIGAIVDVYKGGEAYEVEFVDTYGQTYGLVTLTPDKFIVLSREASERIAA